MTSSDRDQHEPPANNAEAELLRLRRSDEAKSRTLEVLGRVTSRETVDDICRAIVEGVREVFGFDRVGLFIWDDQLNWFRGTFGTGLNGETKDERQIIWDLDHEYYDQFLAGAVFVRGCRLGEPLARPGEEDIKASLTALRRGGRLYGVLSVDNRISRRPITEAQLQPITLLSQILGNAVEISRARQALSASEERFRQVAENSGEWIWEADRDGRYTYASPVVRSLLGYEPAEVVGRPFAAFLAEDGRDLATAEFQDAVAAGKKIERLNSQQVHRDGRHVLLETFAMPMHDAAGALVGCRGVHRDVTHERELEMQLRYAQRMEAIGRLAGGIAHDFNNILTSILGSVSLALDELREGDPIRADLEQIRAAGERAATLTRQLLAFSRRQVLHVRPTDANRIVADMDALLRRVLGEEIELVTEMAPSLAPARADPDQLQQVILQLAVNACDAMVGATARRERQKTGPAPEARTKRLCIRTASVEVSGEFGRPRDLPPGPYAVITMQDTGVGMPETLREHLFDPFYAAPPYVRGSGLGLATVYGIVKQMNGHIDVESEPGRGSTFTIYLPHDQSEEEQQMASAPQQESGKQTILIVEDEEPIRRLMKRMLEMQGFQTLAATNGVEALALCDKYSGQISLIITDMVMPKLDGKRLVEELKKKRADFKVIFMSGYSSEDTVDGEMLGVAVAFIPKPFTQEMLTRKVAEVMKG